MAVFRVILRVDFNTVFAVMDGPGRLVKTILATAGKEFFEVINEISQAHEIRAITKTQLVFRQFSASPLFILFDYQNFEGIALKALQDDETFATMSALVTAVRNEFDIEAETRAGLRLFYVSQIAKERAAVQAAFKKVVAPELHSTVEKHLAKPRDFGLAWEGESSDHVHYTMKAGPFFGMSEAVKYFADPPKESKILDAANFVVDLDQSENMMKRSPDLKWWRPLLQSANTVIPALEAEIQKNL